MNAPTKRWVERLRCPRDGVWFYAVMRPSVICPPGLPEEGFHTRVAAKRRATELDAADREADGWRLGK